MLQIARRHLVWFTGRTCDELSAKVPRTNQRSKYKIDNTKKKKKRKTKPILWLGAFGPSKKNKGKFREKGVCLENISQIPPFPKTINKKGLSSCNNAENRLEIATYFRWVPKVHLSITLKTDYQPWQRTDEFNLPWPFHFHCMCSINHC